MYRIFAIGAALMGACLMCMARCLSRAGATLLLAAVTDEDKRPCHVLVTILQTALLHGFLAEKSQKWSGFICYSLVGLDL